MRNVLTIAGKEFKSYFVSPMAYAVICFMALVGGLVFALMTTASPGGSEASLRNFTGTVVFLLILMSPVVTMRLFAEEKSSGTLEILMSSPVKEYEVVLGKYLAGLGFYGVVLVTTLEFPIIITAITHSTSNQWPEMWPMVVSYLGWILCGSAFLSMGLLASTLTRSQLAAAIVALLILLLFWLIGWLAQAQSGVYADVLRQLSIHEHMSEFEKGVVGLKDVVYFLSVIVFFLFASVRAIESTRWR
ncbi:MAG: ABC transporter permease subunit, partial [Armatimonadota bacterium]